MRRAVTGIAMRFAVSAAILADINAPHPESLINRSDLIIVGTLERLNQWSDETTDYGRGVLVIGESVAGPLSPGEVLTLEWSNPKNLVCPRIENHKYAGKRGLWFFRRSDDGTLTPAPIFWNLEDAKQLAYYTAAVDKLRLAPRVIRVRALLRREAEWQFTEVPKRKEN